MKMGIEVPVGGVIVAFGSEMVCVEDYTDKNGVRIGCGACPIMNIYPCEHLACGHAGRSDGKSTHFEYYYGVKK